ncbi:adenosine kinase, partial [Elasticomyces elasticus]
MSSTYELLCLENPLLDIQAKGDDALLEKYGLKANDAILAEEKHMGLFEELMNGRDAKLVAGGAAQNTARGAQYMLPSDSVIFIGCVGKDKYAEILLEANKKAGLKVNY